MDFRPFNLADTIAAAEGIRSRQAQTAYYDEKRQDAASARQDRNAIRDIMKNAVDETPGAVTGSSPMPGGREVERGPSARTFNRNKAKDMLLGQGYIDEALLMDEDDEKRTLAALDFISKSAPNIRTAQQYALFRSVLEKNPKVASAGELPQEWNPETQALVQQMAGSAQEQLSEFQNVPGLPGYAGQREGDSNKWVNLKKIADQAGGQEWRVDEARGVLVHRNGDMKALPKSAGTGATYDIDPLSGIVVIMDASGQPIGRMNLDQLPEVAPGAAPPAAGAAPGAAPGAAQQASPEQWKQAADVYLQTKLAEGYDVEQIRAAMAQMGFPPEMIPPPVPPEQAPPPVARSPIPGEDEERRAKAAETRARIEAVNQIERVPGAQDRRAEKQRSQAERVAALPAEADQVAASGDPRQIVDWMQDNLTDLKKNHRAVYLRHRDTFERALQAVSQRPMAKATPAAE